MFVHRVCLFGAKSRESGKVEETMGGMGHTGDGTTLPPHWKQSYKIPLLSNWSTFCEICVGNDKAQDLVWSFIRFNIK